MSKKKKRLIGIGVIVVFLAIVAFFVYRVFVGPSMGGGKFGQHGKLEEGEMVYSSYTVSEQEPVYLKGVAELNNDNSYYYDPKIGKVEQTLVKDGQKVSAGQVLFKYAVVEQKEAMEDALLAQTRLYNQREELINQLGKLTGKVYNYQGDALEGYWAQDGNYYYYVTEAIGKGGPIVSDNPMTAEELAASEGAGGQQMPGQAEGGEDGLKAQIRQVNQQIEDVEIKISRLNKNSSEVKAKYGGKVIIDENGLVDEQVPYIRIISDEVSIAGSVDEYKFHTLAEDRPVEIYINAEDRYVTGKITEYDTIPAAGPAPTQTNDPVAEGMGGGSEGAKFNFKVRPDEKIQPGFSVRVQVGLGGLSVPNSAIVEEGDKSYVFVYSDGVANKCEITLEKQGTGEVVMRGIEIGDVLILNPDGVVDGEAVNVHQPGDLDGELHQQDQAEEGVITITAEPNEGDN